MIDAVDHKFVGNKNMFEYHYLNVFLQTHFQQKSPNKLILHVKFKTFTFLKSHILQKNIDCQIR